MPNTESTTPTIDTMTSPDGDPIVAYGTYGRARGLGPRRDELADAESDRREDIAGCAPHGRSDREVVAVDSDGWCWHIGHKHGDHYMYAGVPGRQLRIVWTPGGSRGVRYK